MMSDLGKNEMEILKSVDKGEWKSVRGKKKLAEQYQAYARETFRKDRRINIRLAGRDLEALQKRALIEGMPYQTLIASILHKFAAGRLVEKDI
jgi:predicted DNA binding CopG/RHH family protein